MALRALSQGLSLSYKTLFVFPWKSQSVILEKEMETHSSVLAWRIPWTEEPDGLYSPWGRRELDTTERLSPHWAVCLPFEVYLTITFPPQST